MGSLGGSVSKWVVVWRSACSIADTPRVTPVVLSRRQWSRGGDAYVSGVAFFKDSENHSPCPEISETQHRGR